MTHRSYSIHVDYDKTAVVDAIMDIIGIDYRSIHTVDYSDFANSDSIPDTVIVIELSNSELLTRILLEYGSDIYRIHYGKNQNQ